MAFTKGSKVKFKGNEKFKAVQCTYIWAVNFHEMESYYIEHPDGDVTKEKIRYNGGLPDGFETPHSDNFKAGLRYIHVMPDQIEIIN